jgi:acyl-CoA reductase-like NAD-dependent aldehyde dehydrogenase
MAARRVFVPARLAPQLEARLQAAIASVHAIELPRQTLQLVDDLAQEALLLGARLLYDGRGEHATGPVVLADVRPDMRIADSDIFAPVLVLMPYRYEEEALQANAQCSFALSVSIFGEEKAARRLAAEVVAGCVIVNDVIAPTADPRVCFGGRKSSGFGVTRGRDGLLEMTTPKAIMVRRGDDRTHLRITGNANRPFFLGYIQAVHGSGLRVRLGGIAQILGSLKTVLRQRKTPIA